MFRKTEQNYKSAFSRILGEGGAQRRMRGGAKNTLFALAFYFDGKFPLAEIHLHFAEGKLSFAQRAIIIHAKRDHHYAKRIVRFSTHIPE